MTIIYFLQINVCLLKKSQKHLLNDLIKLIAAIQIFVFVSLSLKSFVVLPPLAACSMKRQRLGLKFQVT